MCTVLVVATGGDPYAGLLQALEAEGVAYTIASSVDAVPHSEAGETVDAVLLDMSVCSREVVRQVVEQCQELRLPMLCGLLAGYLEQYDASWGASDFFLIPPSLGEITARVKQAQWRDYAPVGENVLQVGHLSIDLERYEVFNRGRRVLMTYKEYQLLCVLAASPGRVFTRESLLSQIWGYDYFGGTRTVDVHIRRIRSKIEDPGHTYIETVWNVGYRFRPQGPPPLGG